MKPGRLLLSGGLCLALLFASTAPRPVRAANGVVSPPCDDAAFTTALNDVQASGGGTLSFNCGLVTAVILTSTKAITSTVTIDGGGTITLSGGNAIRHFFVHAGAALTLTRVTISNGYAAGDGGALYNEYGSLVVDQSTFRDNQAAPPYSGGAIVSYGPVTITASLFEANQAANGGALYPRFPAARTTILDSTFRHNRTLSPADGWGGAILSWDGAPVTIANSQFISNTARTGGAIYNVGPLNMRASQIVSNTASTGDGGGIQNFNVMHLDGLAFHGNRAPHNSNGIGGGMSNISGTVVITNTTFSANEAEYFGAIYQAGTLTMTNSTIDNGQLPDYALGTAPNTFTFLRFVTIAGTGNGTTIYNHLNTVFRMRNVLLSHPGGANCSTNLSGPPMTSEGYNLASDNSCNLTQATDLPNTDATLGSLGNNGGLTQTRVPQAGSPAINKGLCLPDIAADQRGVPRPQGPACDIGAVEVQTLWRLFVPAQWK